MLAAVRALSADQHPRAAQAPAAGRPGPRPRRLCRSGELALPARPRGCLRAAAADHRARTPSGYGAASGTPPAANPRGRLLLRLSDRVARSRPQQRHVCRAPRSRPPRRSSSRASPRSAGPIAPLYRSGTLAVIPRAIARPGSAPVFNTRLWRRLRRLAPLSRPSQPGPAVRADRPQPGHDPPHRAARRRRSRARPVAGRMLSAMLIGFNVEVPEGQARRRHASAARRCAPGPARPAASSPMSRSAPTAPPPAGALFGRAARAGQHDRLHQSGRPWPAAARRRSIPTGSPPRRRPGRAGIAWSSTGPAPTPFLRTQGLVSARLRP